MTIEEVQNRVQDIASTAGDPEDQHELEDKLHVDVLKQVASSGDPILSRIAKEALKTQDIDFPRWYA